MLFISVAESKTTRRYTWIVCLLGCAALLKFESLERLEKSGVMKNTAYSTFIFLESSSKWEIY